MNSPPNAHILSTCFWIVFGDRSDAARFSRNGRNRVSNCSPEEAIGSPLAGLPYLLKGFPLFGKLRLTAGELLPPPYRNIDVPSIDVHPETDALVLLGGNQGSPGP